MACRSARSSLATTFHLNICTDAHQGQRNITVLPVGVGMRGGKSAGLGDFGFLAGGVLGREQERVVVEITLVAQPNGIDPVVKRVLEAGPWNGLPLRPATSRPRGFGLRKNPHRCEGWLAKIICDAEEFVEELIAKVEGRPDVEKRGRRIALKLPPKGIQPMLFQMELNESDQPGSVHVFDIVQTDQSGRRGGIRVGVVVVP